jgi:hypothetical protein
MDRDTLNSELKGPYEELLKYIQDLLKNIQNESNPDLSLFFPQVRDSYFGIDNKILFVGKCVNGCDKKITLDLNIDELFKEIKNDEQLRWVEDNKIKRYNTNKSAFWRLIKAISKTNLKEGEWYDNIAWTNLYKISPSKSGNPTAYWKKEQREKCKKILTKEIECFAPKYVIFLTSGWESCFLEQIEKFNNKKWSEYKWNKYVTKYKEIDNRYFILSEHPQGKLEEPHVKAIVEILKETGKITWPEEQ